MSSLRSPVVAATFVVRIAILFAPATVGAQGAVDRDSGRDTAQLRPVVVTATRSPLESGTSPATVTVISGAELRRRGIMRLADALRDVPGVAVVPSGSYGSLTSLFVRGGESDYTKVLIDGVPVNAAGGAIDLAHLTVDDIDRIEVLRGPASVVYGSDAVAGVVQIFTRAGRAGRWGEATVRGGTYGTRDGSAEVGGGSPTLGYSLGGAHHRTRGLFALNNDYRNTSISGQLRAVPRPATDIRVSARATGADYHYPTDFNGDPADSNSHRTERRTVLSLDAGHFIGSRVEARLQLADNEVHAVSDNQPDSPADATLARDDGHDLRRSADGRLNLHVASSSVATVGFAYEHERESNYGVSAFDASVPPDTTRFDNTRFDRAYYGQILAGRRGAPFFTVGGRIDDNERFGTFGTWRLATSLPVSSATRLRLSAGSAFKEPAFNEVYTTSFTIGNPDLRPERSRSVEIGVEHELVEGRGYARVTYFDQRFRDLIQFVASTDPLDFRGSNQNLAAARASGVELETRIADSAGSFLAASYTVLRARVVDAGTGAFGTFEAGKPLLRRPGRSGNVTLGVPTSAGGSASATLNYTSRRDDYDFSNSRRVSLHPYATLDLAANIPIAPLTAERAPAALTFRVANLLGKRYEPALGFPAPRRAMLVGLRLILGD